MSSPAQPLVSVVTPMYNAEKYLRECIQSVLLQTYRCWEYIIVNNCSTDRSLEIAQDYAADDSRIRIYNNHEFVSSAENHHIAFDHISPEAKYCKIVHADDWIFPECIARMVALAEANSSVGIVGAYRLDEVSVNLDGLPYPSTVVPGRELCRATLLGGPYVFGSSTSLLIRSDFIRHREKFFDEFNFPLNDDVAVCYDILQSSDFGFVHQLLTFTRRHNETATTLARRVGAYLPGDLMVLKKYGPIYLAPGEYKFRLKRKTKEYFRFLGRSILRGRGRQFWDFHRKVLKNLGCRHTSLRLIAAAILEAVRLLGHPLETFSRARSLISQTRRR